MSRSRDEFSATNNFVRAFGFNISTQQTENVAQALFGRRQMSDLHSARQYVKDFFLKCEKRDPQGMKPIQRLATSIMNESDKMSLMIEFVVRCRQSQMFRQKAAENGRSPSIVSAQSSPFNRRSTSRARVNSTLPAEGMPHESTRSRANSSMQQYDSRHSSITQQHLSMERQAPRPKSPFRINNTRSMNTTPHTASNQLFAVNNGYNSPVAVVRSVGRDGSPSYQRNGSAMNGNSTIASIRTMSTTTPLSSRYGSAMCETESTVCSSLLSALLGIDSRLFRTDGNRRMIITTTASLSDTHTSIAHRVLTVANYFLHLSHRDVCPPQKMVSEALLASIRKILGEYVADIDGIRRTKSFTFSSILPIVDDWRTRLTILAKCHSLRNSEQLELLEELYIIHEAFAFDENQKWVLNIVLDYTMGVLCKQMIDWMATGVPPCDKWLIENDQETGIVKIRKVPLFMKDSDVQVLLEIGKSLPRVESSSDDDLAAIQQATLAVSSRLSPAVIFAKELTPLFRILRDVVCGIVMRTVVTTGRLKEHVMKATSFFFLVNPRFTNTLYNILKEASLGLRVGSASLSRQAVCSALAAALESSTNETMKDKRKKLEFKLDSLSSLGNTPNVSSRMQFVQPLRPKYEPNMQLMKPIFNSCDDYYEAIFHVLWSIDLARLSSQESASLIPPIVRYLEKHYSYRENAWPLLRMISHIFFIINTTLSRVRTVISIQTANHLRRLLAAIDEKCVDVDDVVAEHLKFCKRVCVIVYLTNNEEIEQQLSSFLQTAFQAQEMVNEFNDKWNQMVEENKDNSNDLKARIAEMCTNRTVQVRLLMDKLNTIQSKMLECVDHQVIFGNDALLE